MFSLYKFCKMKHQFKTTLRLATLTLIISLVFFSVVYAATFIDDTQGEFDVGTYSNTVWDINHVELLSGQTSGTFTSQVFDGGAGASWSQIAWSETLASVEKLIVVDSNADVWKSVDDGITWSVAKDDYTGADSNNATDMVIDGNENIFVLFNQDIWKSTDSGVNWTKINDDYNGSESQNGKRVALDNSNNIYVVEADEDVWQSTDSGVNWIKVGNTNGGNVVGFVGVGATLFAVDTAANVWKSADNGVTWILVKDDYTGADSNNADYMTVDSNGNLYILFNQDVWRSMDSGVSWSKINNDYNGSETQNGLIIACNSSNDLFIAEGDEDIWTSSDSGATWTKKGNTGGGNILGIVFISVSTDITFGTRSGDANPPTDSFSGSLTAPFGDDPSVSNARYFQYQTTFSSDDGAVTPELASVTITYEAAAVDNTAPSAVADLALSDASDSAITVVWTAPGDDANSGTATGYDLRYATSEITAGNWSSAIQVSDEPIPSIAGFGESKVVSGLSASTLYYFALKTSDEIPNESGLSNVPSLATTDIPDTTNPADTTDLSLSGTTASSITLFWTAPGDDANSGTATGYDVRYSTLEITAGNWDSATQATGEPSPSAAGFSETMTVFGLSADTVYYFALKTSDEVPNTSDISNVPSLATLTESEEPSPVTAPAGSGGGEEPRRVVFSGYAYPGSMIEVLRKSITDESYLQVPVESLTIAADGSFAISYIGLANADYLFAVRVKDKDGRGTSILTFNISFFGNSFEVKDIVAPPTIGFEQAAIVKNELMNIIGYATPQSAVELELDGKKYKTTSANELGFWSFNVDTTYLAYGDHSVRARQIISEAKASSFSLTRIFKLSQLSIPKADLNGDSIVDIRDWSVFLFRWDHEDSVLRRQNDLNGDGEINIFDFSIFLQTIKI